MIKKNDILTVKIEDMGNAGEGIGKVDGYPLFVKDAITGDLAEVKVTKAGKSFGYARLMSVITPSPDRVEPGCNVSKSCGGCQLQAMSYEAQLKFKENKVYNNLMRIGKLEDFKMNSIIGMGNPYNYRNKAQFPVGLNREGEIVTGFYAGRTHSIISTNGCALGLKNGDMDINKEITGILVSHMTKRGIKPYDEKTGNGLVRHVLIRMGLKTGQVMVCVIINGRDMPYSEELVEDLKKVEGMTSISLNINRAKNNVILGDKIINLYGKGYIEDFIGDIKFCISPLSFYQVNPVQTEKLYATALKYANLTGNEVVWDLYCGIGTISLCMAGQAKSVLGVEIVPQAIENAIQNAEINNISNVRFVCGKAEDVRIDETHKPDVIVVDPPRKGCDGKLLETIIKAAPKRVVYVSCDSATLARDLNILTANGYKVEEVQPVDMFPMTIHCEVVASVVRKE